MYCLITLSIVTFLVVWQINTLLLALNVYYIDTQLVQCNMFNWTSRYFVEINRNKRMTKLFRRTVQYRLLYRYRFQRRKCFVNKYKILTLRFAESMLYFGWIETYVYEKTELLIIVRFKSRFAKVTHISELVHYISFLYRENVVMSRRRRHPRRGTAQTAASCPAQLLNGLRCTALLQ